MGQALRRVTPAEEAAATAAAEAQRRFSGDDCLFLREQMLARVPPQSVRQQVQWLIERVDARLRRKCQGNDDEYLDDMLWYIACEERAELCTPLSEPEVRIVVAQHVTNITDMQTFLSSSLDRQQVENEAARDLRRIIARGTPSIVLKRHRKFSSLALLVGAVRDTNMSLVTELDLSEAFGALGGDALPTILERCTSVRKLSLAYWSCSCSHCNPATCRVRRALSLLHAMPLEELDLTGVRENLSCRWLAWMIDEVPHLMRHLRRLLLARMRGNLQAKWSMALGAGSQIEELDVSDWKCMNGGELAEGVRASRSLRVLNLSGVPPTNAQVDDHSTTQLELVVQAAIESATIHTLLLARSSGDLSKAMRTRLLGSSRLHTVDLSDCPQLSIDAVHENLRHLDLSRFCALNPALCAALAHGNIESLCLQACTMPKATAPYPGGHALAKNRQNHKVLPGDAAVMEQCLQALSHSQSLRVLQLRGNMSLAECNFANVLSMLSACSRLEELDFTACNLGEGSFDGRSNELLHESGFSLPALKRLGLSENKILVEVLTAVVRALPSLEHLDLRNCNLSDITPLLRALERVPVRSMSLDNNRLEGLSVDMLSRQLRDGSLRLRSLSLMQCQLSTEGASALLSAAACASVEMLDLCWNNLDDSLAEHIEDLISSSNDLRALRLYGNNFSYATEQCVAHALAGNRLITSLQFSSLPPPQTVRYLRRNNNLRLMNRAGWMPHLHTYFPTPFRHFVFTVMCIFCLEDRALLAMLSRELVFHIISLAS